MNLSKQET